MDIVKLHFRFGESGGEVEKNILKKKAQLLSIENNLESEISMHR